MLPGRPPDRRRPLAHWPFRLAVTLAAVLLADQAVFAGQFLAGSFPALHTHRQNATFAGVTLLVAAATGVPLHRPGGGPLWPALTALVGFGLVAAQIALGFARALAVHVPLGVVIIALTAALAVWSWRYHPETP